MFVAAVKTLGGNSHYATESPAVKMSRNKKGRHGGRSWAKKAHMRAVRRATRQQLKW